MENPNLQRDTGEGRFEQSGVGYGYAERPSRRGYYTLIAVIVMLTVAAVFARGQWLRIHYVEIRGLVNKSSAEVLALAGIDENSTYFNLSEKKIRSRIDSDRYLEFVAMERGWPDRLLLIVRERQQCANFLYMGIQYVLSADGMVLEASNSISLDNGCIKVTGLNVRDIRMSARVVCQQELQLDAMEQILEELRMQGVFGEIAELNLSSLESIYLVTLDGFTANIGSVEELRAKIGTVRAVVEELRRRNLGGGMIEATVPGQASYRPIQ